MKIFISNQRVDENYVKVLIEKLREEGFVVFHSPNNPADVYDFRWKYWYEKGFEKELIQTEVFIAVIDGVWDSSTWMAHESDIAHKFLREGKIKKAYFWNPKKIVVRAAGVKPYLKEELPKDIDELIGKLRA